MQRLRLLVLGLSLSIVAASDVASAQHPADSAQQELVARLYRQFSWEATGGDNGPGGRTFIDQPRRVLLQYLEPSLADLLLRDRACVRRSGAICRLDFVPLWASQDPDAEDIAFEQTTGRTGNAVVARVRSRDGSVTRITYRLRRTRAGWRIADIEYTQGASLRTLLQGHP